MYKVEFNYHEYIREAECDYDETLRSICKRYTKKVLLDINSLHFLYLGKEINLDLNFSQIASEFDKIRKIIEIVVVDRNIGELNMIKSSEIICPECYSSALLEIEEFGIKIFDCRNGHNAGRFLLDEIEESQMIDLTQIKCESCRIYSRGYTYNKEFYRCNTCKINLCPICEMKHDKKHRVIHYERRNYVCESHSRSYHSFCKTCKKNMCVLCEKDHENHQIVYLHKMIKRDEKELKDTLKKIKDELNIFVRDIKMIINKLNLIKENMKSFYELYYNIIYTYDEKRVNYEILKNLDEVRNNQDIFELLKDINQEKDIYEKFKMIYDMYNNMIYKKEVNMVYTINKHKETLKIFGLEFVRLNKEKCKMVINNVEQELKSVIKIKDNLKDKIKVKLLNIDKITNMSFLFHECPNLYSCSDLSKWNTSNVKDMHKLFYGCNQLISLPDISYWSISKVMDICGMFYDCNSIQAVPDISEWDVSNVSNLSGLFCGCEKVKTLPDISQWNTSNVTDMNSIFCGCSSLQELPNIERWTTDKVKNMSGLFCGCASIKKLPNISRWNIEKVKDLSGMFFSCSKLLLLPDISKWNTKNVKNMTGMFGECSMLNSLPDLNKWEMNKGLKIVNMFKGCQEILEIPKKFRLNEAGIERREPEEE